MANRDPRQVLKDWMGTEAINLLPSDQDFCPVLPVKALELRRLQLLVDRKGEKNVSPLIKPGMESCVPIIVGLVEFTAWC